jgi:hypothetical protein
MWISVVEMGFYRGGGGCRYIAAVVSLESAGC